MALNPPPPGLGATGEWTASPIPWLTASSVASTAVVRLDMPNVASRFTLRNTAPSGSLRFGFTYNGVTLSNYLTVNPGESFDEQFRFKSIYLYAPYNNIS